MEKASFPKIHNAAWPGVVGKAADSDQPPISLDEMITLTANAEVNGNRFDGIDLFLFDPHLSIDASTDELKALADQCAAHDLVIGSVVAPVWEPTGGGSAFGSEAERTKFLLQVDKGCRIASELRELGIRPYGVVRIDSAGSPADWSVSPADHQALIASTFQQAAKIADGYGETLAAEGEICWGGMHSWRWMLDLLERVDQPDRLGFQADMAHTLLYTLGHNAEEHRLLPPDFDWDDAPLDQALQEVTQALRPWTVDFHVAQNDATVHGTGSHDKTGRHCLPDDPAGKLDIPKHAGYWLRDEQGQLTTRFQHICWDGCMFPNETLLSPATWDSILATMIDVRDAHGWDA